MRSTGQRPRDSDPLALTGTPGTGKTSVGRWLARTRPVVEVSELALRSGAGRRAGRRSVEVDLRRLSRAVRRPGGLPARAIVVGHLAHLLPVRDVVILRCRPDVLARRLRGARRGTASDRRENYLAEALDLISIEARTLRRRVWEVDTTGRTVRAVATDVGRIARRRTEPAETRIDWLADRRVAEHLLDPPG